MKKPIKRVAFKDSFALLGIGEIMEIPAKDSGESAVRKSASVYSTKNGVTLSVAFDRERLITIVTRTA